MTTHQPTQLAEKRQRFAIYARYSSEMQNELSLEAQEACCRQAIAERGGVVVGVFKDGARSGWSLDRDGFTELRATAERGRFDAVMFWKFDRLARDHNHAVMIKMLMRHEYNLKLYCVQGFSEDDDDSPYTAMMEQMLGVWSAFYSKNLSSETKRGKHQRAVNGDFNGSIAPLGYDLIVQSEAKAERPGGLYINPRHAVIVRRAFRLYSTGRYSFADIATWMNQRPVIQKLRIGQLPVNREMIRDMLQNRVYTGRVRYTETLYKKTLGEGRSTKRHRSEWFEGKHQGFVSDELFEQCQIVRQNAASLRNKVSNVRTYILHDRVYCARCIARKPIGLTDDNYGKMRPYFQGQHNTEYYRCLAHDRGYEKCGQKAAHANKLDNQIVAILSSMTIPEDFRIRIEEAVRSRIENDAAFQRMEQIEEIVKRVDFSWEQGFLEKDAYFAKRSELQRELESLRPIDYDELIEAADLLQNFRTYWNECGQLDEPLEARKQLIAKLVDRVFVYNDKILALVLYGDFAVVLGENKTAPSEVEDAVQSYLAEANVISLEISSRSGDDGVRTRDLCLDRAIC
jgi:site-specific DNA recombinase